MSLARELLPSISSLADASEQQHGQQLRSTYGPIWAETYHKRRKADPVSDYVVIRSPRSALGRIGRTSAVMHSIGREALSVGVTFTPLLK